MSTVNETYFPELLKIITEDPLAAERLDLECPICKESTTINNSNDPTGFGSHDAYILPCMHIVGLSCATNLILHDRKTETTHRCPTCRADLFHSGCGHPNTKGTLLHLSEAWRPTMIINILDSNRLDEFCMACYFEFITDRLTRIAFDESDLSNFVTGGRVVKLFLKWEEKVYKALSCPKNTTTIMELPIQPILKNAIERIREPMAKLLNVPADKTAELEFHLVLLELNPAQDLESLLHEFSFLSQITDMQDVAVALQRPGVSRESIANENMLQLCQTMTSGQELNAQVRSHIRSGLL
ncbi:uncharacterized protein QYS62_001953 [Fusarium acuminatum]|uniref:RING-type domain-containing protein n=1 Tax=Fusarium acuminatum TaxID=5515 RepID=A0ABZ2WK02_9HYPO